jgi:crotonobetainyl-CoA:carnitine CoA-transferase CaiB-like acyl-CoA transferase
VLCGAPVVDTMGALMGAIGVLTALLHRERTGEGQRVDISLLSGALLSQAARLSVFLATGVETGRQGSAHPYLVPFQAFRARDGWIYVGVWIDRLWPPFCAAVQRPDLVDDPRFATRDMRRAHRAELVAILEPIFAADSVRGWLERLESHDVLGAPVNGYADLPEDPRVKASGMIVDEEHPRAGRFRTLAPPLRFSRTPGTIRTGAPALGEHTEAVLAEAGFASSAIAQLRAAGVVC